MATACSPLTGLKNQDKEKRMLFLEQVDIQGKRVLMRVDYNVPLDDGVITDDNRIRASLPTINYILDKGASLVLCSHLGKPKGKKKPKLSLKPVAERLQELLDRDVIMAPDCIGEEVFALAQNLKPGQVMLLENLRFHPGEQKNDPDFARELAKMGEVYVNDAFGVAHRAHASVVGVVKNISVCCAGLLLEKEWKYLSRALQNPERPFVAVSGGAKVSSKLGILNSLLDKVDCLLIGGAMANTFLRAQGVNMGRSLVEEDLIPEAREILAKARQKGVSLYLPVDFIAGTGPDGEIGSGVCPYQDIPQEEMALDIGPATHILFTEALKCARTVVWNGPMGAFENSHFAMGSKNLAETIASLDALTIVGGGDTDALIHKAGLTGKFSFISTGGGSFLQFLEGRELPAFKALEECGQ
jgi:phosphoglycerate kinase